MSTKTSEAGPKTITAILNPQGQTRDSVNAIVENILGRAGCHTCGLIAILKVSLVGDPSPELAKSGVISVTTESLG